MRPPSHMPLAERMTFGRVSALMAMDSSTVDAVTSPSNVMGFTPACSSAAASSS